MAPDFVWEQYFAIGLLHVCYLSTCEAGKEVFHELDTSLYSEFKASPISVRNEVQSQKIKQQKGCLVRECRTRQWRAVCVRNESPAEGCRTKAGCLAASKREKEEDTVP